MKNLLLQTAMAWACASGALPTDPVAAFYGNTVTISAPPLYFEK